MTKAQQDILALIEAEDPAAVLRDLREQAGLSQAELAVYIGVAPSTVYRWETGQGEPSIGQAKRIADVLRGNWPKASNLSSPEMTYSFWLSPAERGLRFPVAA